MSFREGFAPRFCSVVGFLTWFSVAVLGALWFFGCSNPQDHEIEGVVETDDLASDVERRWQEIDERERQRWVDVEESLRAREEAIKSIKLPEKAKVKSRKQGRSVRRWQWKSPAARRAETWNVPREESTGASIVGLLRICTSEQEGSEADCRGIWQVLNNIRNRSCNRPAVPLITECDVNGETIISVMRRASRFVVGAAAPRHDRQRWISQLDVSCEMPDAFPRTVRRVCSGEAPGCPEKLWSDRHRRHCERTVELATGLVTGRDKQRVTGAPIIAWGGRCEVPRGACDDAWGCARGFIRDPSLEASKVTANAFWCRPGSRGCGDEGDIDPICVQMGYGG